jgi:hypothetical protein
MFRMLQYEVINVIDGHWVNYKPIVSKPVYKTAIFSSLIK